VGRKSALEQIKRAKKGEKVKYEVHCMSAVGTHLLCCSSVLTLSCDQVEEFTSVYEEVDEEQSNDLFLEDERNRDLVIFSRDSLEPEGQSTPFSFNPAYL